jgi:hypothetical protein
MCAQNGLPTVPMHMTCEFGRFDGTDPRVMHTWCESGRFVTTRRDITLHWAAK